MKPKDMTLGELVCEYIHAYMDYRLACHEDYYHGGDSVTVSKAHKITSNFRTELVIQLNRYQSNKQREKDNGQKPIS